MLARITLALLVLASVTTHAQTDDAASTQKSEIPGGATIPAYLTLQAALNIAEINGTPDIEIAEADIIQSNADLDGVRSRYGLRMDLVLNPAYVVPVTSGKGDTINDSFGGLTTRKVISDFGQTEALTRAAEAELRAEAMEFVSARFRHRLRIIQAYFNVLLADRRYAVDDELMTIRYLKYDKARDRHELGEVSEVDLLELESSWREMLIPRARSANRQSEARAHLAALLNRPDEFPANLEPLEIDVEDIELPGYEALLKDLLEKNPEVLAQKERVESARASLEHMRMFRRPTLDSALQYGNYERRYGDGDKWRAELNLRVPIMEGGKYKADIARQHAELRKHEATYKALQNSMRKTSLELVQELEALKIANRSASVRLDYADLNLDRSRSIYEMEVRTDLGDAAAKMTEATWNADKVRYDLLLSLASIDAMLGIDPGYRFLEKQP